MKTPRILGLLLIVFGILSVWYTYGDFNAAHASYSSPANSIPLIGPLFRMLGDFTRLASAGFFFASFFPIIFGIGFLIVPESEWKGTPSVEPTPSEPVRLAPTADKEASDPPAAI